jgi:hypothetical protein
MQTFDETTLVNDIGHVTPVTPVTQVDSIFAMQIPESHFVVCAGRGWRAAARGDCAPDFCEASASLF